MFAVIKTGGKQYRVEPNDVIRVERLAGEAGDAITFDQVLMLGGEGAETAVGAPLVEGASVTGTVVDQTRGRKIIIFKKKRRKNHRRRNGHRQDLTEVRITDVLAAGGKTATQKSTKSTTKSAAKSKAGTAKTAAKTTAKKPVEKAAPEADAAGAED
ncbi:MAG TPA: 50S ribosomal protein L21 [Alphaproteobacteria bacterium]|jgi:large subunit ribosomal protein L21|nr:50S ribosomal protein L21 [Alphaproteobacteria bacterium]